jgi:hypothetical protein
MSTDTPVVPVAYIPGLLGLFDDGQQATLIALAGMDLQRPRTLAEALDVLDTDVDDLYARLALISRTLVRELNAPDPDALRLLCAVFSERRLLEDATRPGIFSLIDLVPALGAPAFPFARRVYLHCLWTGGPREQTVYTGVRLRDPQHRELLRDEAPLTMLGEGAVTAQEFELHVEFPEPGRYTVETWLIGAPIYTQYLPVYRYVPPEEKAADDAD